MTTRKIFILIILWITFSCGDNKSHSEKVIEMSFSENISSDDYKIINSTFPHLVIIQPVGATREFGYDNFNLNDRQIPDEYLRNVFFTKNLVPLNDTVDFNIRPSNKLNIEDSTFKILYKRLFTDRQNELTIEIDSITNIGFWRLIPVNKGQRIEREIGEGIITYSRIIYNIDKTQAAFYFQNNCSGLCGFAKFVHVQKVNGIWNIIKEYDDWIS